MLLMEPIDELLEWASPKGITFDGIAPQRMEGRGIGLVATKEIQANKTILQIPTSCLRTLDTVPKSLARKLPLKISIQGLLAADLALDDTDKYSPWNAVCPTIQDLSTIPLLWPEELQALLPHTARVLLEKQKSKYAQDWAGVKPLSADGEQNSHDELQARYRHAWLLVNTRTFYYTNTKLKKRPKHDHMTLQPVADLFNHTDDDGAACQVVFDYKGFNFKTTRAYTAGEEVHICYGRHGNDKLLVEYGFAMDGNRWDEVGLDEVLLKRLDEKQSNLLDQAGFLGKYVLDREDVCYRTQVALRALCCKAGEWRRFADGVDDGAGSQKAVDGLVLEIVREYADDAARTVEKVEGMNVGEKEQRDTLLSRWRQIQEILRTHMERLEARV